MIENNVEEIISPEKRTSRFSAKESKKIVLDNSSVEVPENAFLNAEGQLYTGEVKLDVQEFMDPITNALASAPMSIRGATSNEVYFWNDENRSFG